METIPKDLLLLIIENLSTIDILQLRVTQRIKNIIETYLLNLNITKCLESNDIVGLKLLVYRNIELSKGDYKIITTMTSQIIQKYQLNLPQHINHIDKYCRKNGFLIRGGIKHQTAQPLKRDHYLILFCITLLALFSVYTLFYDLPTEADLLERIIVRTFGLLFCLPVLIYLTIKYLSLLRVKLLPLKQKIIK